jgi:hypothetical protein
VQGSSIRLRKDTSIVYNIDTKIETWKKKKTSVRGLARQYGVNMVNYVEDIVCGVTQNEAKISDIENRISDTNPDQNPISSYSSTVYSSPQCLLKQEAHRYRKRSS